MTTVSQLITDAYQYNNIVALSVIPNAAEQAKALRYLNRIFRSVFGNELGDVLNSWTLSDTGIKPSVADSHSLKYYSPFKPDLNTRVVANVTSSVTLTLPTYPTSGARFALQDASKNLATYPLTVNANGRLIEGAATVTVSTNGANLEWFFRDDIGTWVKVSDLALTDDFPLPVEFEEYFIMMLAMRLGASEDIDLNNQLVFVLKDVTKKFKARYRQTTEMGLDAGIINLTSNPYGHTGTLRFNNG